MTAVSAKPRLVLAVAVLVAVTACSRRPKAVVGATTEAGAPPSGREANLPLTSSLKEASDRPADPIAAVEAKRLEDTAAPSGALSDPQKLADVCRRARVACGFELRADAWSRPEARTSLPNATAAQALAAFAGKDYRLAWIGPVAHVFPAEPGGPLPLDAIVTADVSPDSPSTDPESTLGGIARKLGLETPPLPARARRTNVVGSSSMPITNTARFILDDWCRPALLHPSSYVATYGPGGAGSLRWFWGETPAR
jgi:hypothetical protein